MNKKEEAMKNLFLGFVAIAMVLGMADIGRGEPKIETKTVEYNAQGVAMKSHLSPGRAGGLNKTVNRSKRI